MDIIEVLGYVGAVLIGLVLGLIGGGGSILTVPILVYILGIDAVTATAYSLFVVGATSLVGAVRNTLKGMVDFQTGVVFAIPALLAVYATRAFLVPAIPETIFTVGDFTLSKDIAIMVLFAVIMLMASYSMIKGRKESDDAKDKKFNYPLILLEGAVVGVLTGIVGAGGGFLIIPALVLLAGVPMKRAVATSLFIVSVKSLIGFLGDVQSASQEGAKALVLDWQFLLVFTSISMVGIFLGIYLNRFVDGKSLKKGFGWFLVVMGVYIIAKETVLS